MIFFFLFSRFCFSDFLFFSLFFYGDRRAVYQIWSSRLGAANGNLQIPCQKGFPKENEIYPELCRSGISAHQVGWSPRRDDPRPGCNKS